MIFWFSLCHKLENNPLNFGAGGVSNPTRPPDSQETKIPNPLDKEEEKKYNLIIYKVVESVDNKPRKSQKHMIIMLYKIFWIIGYSLSSI